MNKRLAIFVLSWLIFQPMAYAATTATGVSPTGGILKMLFGLVVVLAFVALISWGFKRMMPGGSGVQSTIRIVGGVSVGSRERVVVLEVADRWLVVGVAPGQVSNIANLEIGASKLSQSEDTPNQTIHPMMQPLVKSFADLLSKSSAKFKQNINEKQNAKD